MKAKLGIIIGIQLAILGCSLDDPIECAVDKTKCANNKDNSVGMLYKCDGGKWGEPEACLGNALCKDEISCDAPECENGAQKCENTAAGGVVQKCVDYHWTVGEPCADNVLCENEVSCPERCVPKTIRCTVPPLEREADAVLQSCDPNGKWITFQSCPPNHGCKDETTCDDDNCTPGQHSCENSQNGESSIGLIKICESNRMWSNLSACPGNTLCEDAETCAEPVVINCNEEEVSCTNVGKTGQLKKCVKNEYVTETCPNDAACKNDMECGDCKTDDVKCADGKMFVCGKGIWEESAACENNKCFDETRCQQCTSTCKNKDGYYYGVVTTVCEDNTTKKETCEAVSCNPEGTGCGNCLVKPPKDGDLVTCENDEKGVGHLTGCQNGQSFEGEACEGDFSCKDDGSGKKITCGECRNGTTRCVMREGTAMLELCVGGVFSGQYDNSYIKCRGSEKCNDAGTACADVDSFCFSYGADYTGYLASSDGTFKTCYSDSCDPATQQNCTVASCNSEFTACGECLVTFKGPKTTCSEDEDGIGHMKGCIGGAHVDEVCKDNAGCGSVFGCNACRNGAWKCEVNEDGKALLITCKDGVWASDAGTYDCPESMGCNSDNTFCDTTEESLCVRRTATPSSAVLSFDGTTVTVGSCSDPVSCTDDGKCGECHDMAEGWCEDGVAYSCKKGVPVGNPCASGKCAEGNKSCEPESTP